MALIAFKVHTVLAGKAGHPALSTHKIIPGHAVRARRRIRTFFARMTASQAPALRQVVASGTADGSLDTFTGILYVTYLTGDAVTNLACQTVWLLA